MYLLIVNPKSGNGKGQKIYEAVKQHPLYVEKGCRTFLTEYEGHGERLASQVVHMYGEKIKTLIVIGGDGTVHEVLNGLKSYPSMKLAVIPAGSGNDFARGINIREKGLALFQDIVTNAKWEPYWLGKVKHNEGKQQFLFANSIGIGFDGEVAHKSNHSKASKLVKLLHLHSFRYIFALIQTLFSFQPKELEMKLDGNNKTFSKAWMVTITNHPYFGGGMKIVPQAKIDKDYFYLFVLDGISKWKVLFLFFTVYFGKHLKFKEVHVYKAREIIVKSNKKIVYQADGQTGKLQSCYIKKELSTRHFHRS